MLNEIVAPPIHILLVDAHPIVRFGFIALLKQMDSAFVFHETDNIQDAETAVKIHAPRVAIVDLSLAGTLSLELIKTLHERAPDMAILVVSMHDEKLYAERVLRAGARGYVMKQIAAKSIVLAVQTVIDGKIWLSDEFRTELVNGIARDVSTTKKGDLRSLSNREVAVFHLIGKGLKKSDISKELNLSPNTVETYRSNIKEKLGIASGAELYRSAFLHLQDESLQKQGALSSHSP